MERVSGMGGESDLDGIEVGMRIAAEMGVGVKMSPEVRKMLVP